MAGSRSKALRCSGPSAKAMLLPVAIAEEFGHLDAGVSYGSGASVLEMKADSRRRIVSSSEWDDFVDASPQGSIYCKTWWLDAVCPDAYQLIAIPKDGIIRA